MRTMPFLGDIIRYLSAKLNVPNMGVAHGVFRWLPDSHLYRSILSPRIVRLAVT